MLQVESRQHGAAGKGERIVGFSGTAEGVPSASAIRSTTLISSLSVIETSGRADLYWQLLPRDYHETIRQLVAGAWLPMDVGIAHYATVEQLGFSALEARENGRHVAQTIQNSHFANVVRAMGSTVTLWTVLPRLPAFLGRLVQGGACAVYRLGPKDARLEFHSIPIARFEYVRCGWAGMFESTLGLITRRVYAHDVSLAGGAGPAVFSVAWV